MENLLDYCRHLVWARIYNGETRLDNGFYRAPGQMKLRAVLTGWQLKRTFVVILSPPWADEESLIIGVAFAAN